jgi:hypothetical protein
LDGEEGGAGDPAEMTFVTRDTVAVALGGVDRVAFVDRTDKKIGHLAVGRRPTAIARSARGTTVVVNRFDDSLTVIDPNERRVIRTIAFGSPSGTSSRDRGERHFFDARLSLGGTMSCHSCHTDGHTNGRNADTLGDGTFGTPKRTLTLMGTALTDPWAWNGSQKYLHDQVQKSLVETMHTASVRADSIDDLTTFLHSLPPPPPLRPSTSDEADRASLERGRRQFAERGCVRCHIPPLTYTSHGPREGGFADERGERKFNPPSLRGVGQGGPWLEAFAGHDSRRRRVAGCRLDPLGQVRGGRYIFVAGCRGRAGETGW